MAYFDRRKLDEILAFHGGFSTPRVAVETGTHTQKTTKILANVFKEVHTIEIDTKLFSNAIAHAIPNVTYYEGDSAYILKRNIFIMEPVFWYLDAHWYQPNDGSRIGGKGYFPLWLELEVIRKRSYADVIVIDDAHSFGDTSPTPEWRYVTRDNILKHLGFAEGTFEHKIIGDQFVISRKEWR